MALLVQKYGGTSVGSVERIQAVAKRVARARLDGHDLVVVVSAMGHTTDELTALARALNPDPPQREMDMLLATGEQVSIALLSMAIESKAIETCSPVASSMSISRWGGSGLRARASAVSSSVVWPIAETTTTRSWPSRRALATRLATAWMRSTLPTEVPPYF